MRRRRHPTLPALAGRNNYLANDDHEEIGRKVAGAVVLADEVKRRVEPGILRFQDLLLRTIPE
jgi:hypothetical protein